mgnify:CR=1 FL=1
MAGTIRAQYPDSFRPIRVMCTARVSSDMIMRAFGKGAAGVMIAGWHINECDFKTGNLYARELVNYLQEVMETIGLERERLNMIFISAAEGERFKQLAIEMEQKIRKLGLSTIQEINASKKAADLAKAQKKTASKK